MEVGEFRGDSKVNVAFQGSRVQVRELGHELVLENVILRGILKKVIEERCQGYGTGRGERSAEI